MVLYNRTDALKRIKGLLFLKKKLGVKKEEEKIKIIEGLLQKEDCFKELTIEEAYNILKFLAVPEDEIPLLYALLITDKEDKKDVYLIDVSYQENLSKIDDELKIILQELHELLEKKKKNPNLQNEDKMKIIFLNYFLNLKNKDNPFVGLSYTFISDILRYLEVKEEKIPEYYIKLSKIKELLIPITALEKVEML